MKLVSPRLTNLARSVKDAQREGATDGELHVPGLLHPVFLLSEPLRRDQCFVPNVLPGQAGVAGGMSATFTVANTLAQAGVNPGQAIQFGTLSPGIWRVTLDEEYSFTGTPSGSTDFLQVLPQQTGAAQMQILQHFHLVGIRTKVYTMDLTCDAVVSLTLLTGPTIAGDALNWAVSLFAQRLF